MKSGYLPIGRFARESGARRISKVMRIGLDSPDGLLTQHELALKIATGICIWLWNSDLRTREHNNNVEEKTRNDHAGRRGRAADGGRAGEHGDHHQRHADGAHQRRRHLRRIFSSDPIGSPVGTPGLSYGGVEYVNHGTPISWYRFQNSAGDVTASLGSNPFSAVTYGAGTTAAVSLAFGSLSFVQTIAITAANILSVNVSITNNGADMRSVKWGVGFDPDQGISLGGGYATDNQILGQGSAAAVRASYFGGTTSLCATPPAPRPSRSPPISTPLPAASRSIRALP
jgi:hypothetical protein